MPSIVTRSAWGSALQSTQFAGLPFNLLPNTTLNEALSIQAGVPPTSGNTPTVKYYCIGNKGHQFQTGGGGVALVQSIPHSVIDANLYGIIPFVLRLVSNDLTPTQQANYALRKILTIGSNQYVAYYLRRIVTSATVVNIQVQTIVNGVTSSTAFVPSSANLNPTPPNLSNAGQNVLTSEFINVSATLPINLLAFDCSELLNMATILFGDPSYAIISEIGICSGVDSSVAVPGGGNFLEAIAVQIVAFISAFHSIQYTPTGLSGTLDLGSNSPGLILS